MKNVVLFLSIFCTVFADTKETSLNKLNLGGHASEYLRSNQLDEHQTLVHFIESSDDKSRSGFFSNIWKDVQSSEDINANRNYTDILVAGLDDDYFGTWVLKRLSLPPFEEDFFSSEAKESIARHIPESGHQARHIRLLGVAGLDAPKMDLDRARNKNELFPDDRANALLENVQRRNHIYYESKRWASLLYEARNGNRDALTAIIEDVSNTPIPALTRLPNVIYDLGYVRQNEAVDLLVRYLFEEVTPLSERLRGDSIITPIAHHAVKGLSQSLIDFPVDYWDPITDEALATVREFINNYEGEWRIIGKPRTEEEQSVEVAEVTEEVISLKSSIEEPAQVAVAKHIEEDVEQPSKWWLLLIGVIIVLIGIASLYRAK